MSWREHPGSRQRGYGVGSGRQSEGIKGLGGGERSHEASASQGLESLVGSNFRGAKMRSKRGRCNTRHIMSSTHDHEMV